MSPSKAESVQTSLNEPPTTSQLQPRISATRPPPNASNNKSNPPQKAKPPSRSRCRGPGGRQNSEAPPTPSLPSSPNTLPPLPTSPNAFIHTIASSIPPGKHSHGFSIPYPPPPGSGLDLSRQVQAQDNKCDTHHLQHKKQQQKQKQAPYITQNSHQ